jgi:hypothetical protein
MSPNSSGARSVISHRKPRLIGHTYIIYFCLHTDKQILFQFFP